MQNKRVVIIGGGTINPVRPHLALCDPAYGQAARQLSQIWYAFVNEGKSKLDVQCVLTKMAGGNELAEKYSHAWMWPYKPQLSIETTDQLDSYVDTLIADLNVKVIIFSAAVCDFNGGVDNAESLRLHSDRKYIMQLTPANKIISKIRKQRKDIFLVGFKTTAGATEDEQYVAGLKLCKQASCNLVLANDIVTRTNMIITPEEARYHVTKSRLDVLHHLAEMANLR